MGAEEKCRPEQSPGATKLRMQVEYMSEQQVEVRRTAQKPRRHHD